MNAQATQDDAGGSGQSQESQRADRLARKEAELLEFRAAGILTQAELEEQLTKFRWGIP